MEYSEIKELLESGRKLLITNPTKAKELIDNGVDELCKKIRTPFKSESTLLVKEGEKDSEDWISVSEKLPEPNVKAPSYRKGEAQYLCICNENGYLSEQLLNYGDFEFVDVDGDFHDADEHGFVKRFGWSYERDSEGEYDSLVFDMNGKVVFWREIPNFKNTNTTPPKEEQQKTGNNEK